MANGNGNGHGNMAKYYLNIVMTLCAILIAILGYVMNQAVNRNDAEHINIKNRMSLKADGEDMDRIERSIDKLVDRMTIFIDKAPPRHIHVGKNGEISRIVE